MPITTCDSPEILKAEIDSIRKKVTVDETEETWDTISRGIQHLTALCNSGGCEFPSEMVVGVRSISRPLSSALNSERSRLSGAAIELLTALAIGLTSSFEPLVSQFLPTLLALCSRTNKVFTSRARACILAIIQHTRLPSLLPHLTELGNHKSVLPRLTAAEGVLACLNCFNPPDLEKESRARTVEDFIKLTARDANADVRRASKDIFKAYRTLMPARVDGFVAPLTPVIKKYLDIPPGPTANHGVSSNVVQKQISRPSSRANNKVAEMGGQRSTGSTLSKPPTRPVADDLAQSVHQRSSAHNPQTAVDNNAPRKRTTSQIQHNPPQIPNLRIKLQSSGIAQRCVLPTSAPACQAGQPPASGVVRALPSRSALMGAPQRPPPMQMKLNPPPDRLKGVNNGAKRIPLPSPDDGQTGEPVTMTTNSTNRASSPVVQSRSKLPSRNIEAMRSTKLATGRKIPEGTRLTSVPIKSANGTAPTGPGVVQRGHKPLVKGEMSKPSETAPLRRPVKNLQKGTRPLAKGARKETSPKLIPLPPSPTIHPAEIPLPPSPDCVPHPTGPDVQDEPIAGTLFGIVDPAGNPSTPITTLLSSIQRGFVFTPSSPLSPPQNYLLGLGNSLEQNVVVMNDFTKGLTAAAPSCASFEGEPGNGLNRHALKDLN